MDMVDNDTENNHQLFTTDREILLHILPSNVWAYTFKKLEKKHPSSLENVSNSSLYFRNLVLSKRILFLFPQVFKLIGPEFASQKDTKIQGSNIISTRTTCMSWNKAIDKFIIDDTLQPDFFNKEPTHISDHAMVNARSHYFGHVSPTKLTKFLSHFQQTHLPHHPRNPFIGKVVHIDLTGFTDNEELALVADQVSTLLRKYGHHIHILNLGLFKDYSDRFMRLENHVWLLECLGHCPNLTHLKVFERFNPNGEMDVAFGERPDPRRRRHEDIRNFHVEERLVALENYFGNVFNRFVRIGPLDIDHNNDPLHPPVVPQNVPIDDNLIATLRNLKCLKLSHLSFLNFNTLITANTHVIWLQIEPLSVEKQRYVDYYRMEFPKLKKLSIKLCSPTDVRDLSNAHESWLQLTHLFFYYCTSGLCCFSPEFMTWMEIFRVIYEKWGNTLTDLRLRLPRARRDEDKQQIERDSTQELLDLPKLKRLQVWLSERPGEARVAKTDFLDKVRVQLEELSVE